MLSPFHLSTEAPTATLPLALATLVVTSPLSLISFVGLSVMVAGGDGMERAADQWLFCIIFIRDQTKHVLSGVDVRVYLQ